MICSGRYLCIILILAPLAQCGTIQDVQRTHENKASSEVESSVNINCNPESMVIAIKNLAKNQKIDYFSGMIYPKGLPKNSTCLTEYRNHKGTLQYKLPLRSCNTMSLENEKGEIEFFNTIVVQPHLKLVTDMGRGFHVRCTYKNREAIILNKKNSKHLSDPKKLTVSSNDRHAFGRSYSSEKEENINSFEFKSDQEIPMPGVHMKIYAEDKIAENVNIGDSLKLAINIEEQKNFVYYITNCIVRDGLGWGEQKLIDDDGCPTDNEIMGPFQYSSDKLSASVIFPAHKFPYTTSIYYQCNVNLCDIEDLECSKMQEVQCNDKNRRKRQTAGDSDNEGTQATIEVFSGLHVNENAEITENFDDVTSKLAKDDNELCVSQRTFAIAIAIAGLALMLLIIAAVICIMSKRRTKMSHSESSIYSGPYTNTAFSHSS